VARIKDSSVEEVRAAVDMVELVSARTQLRRVGGRYTGRCPFHEERTPSFSVNPQDKLYYCFGCGAGGDAITFVRETEQLDFAQAVEWIADRFRVSLEYEEGSPAVDAKRRRRERLVALLERATSFYERYLWAAEAGAPVRDYLTSRGFGEEVCRDFRLGLAPGGATLARRALDEGYTREELSAAGLINRRGNDYFSGRLLFPLADARGRVCGFQARKIREDDPLPAKYVNSPEGELFRKGDLLYGLDKARRVIAKQDRAIVVEGNPDVIALRQTGFEPVVASMGTALTERQLRELSRLTSRLFLCFDADAAGEEATLRGMKLAATSGFDVYVVPMPPGQDPADAPEQFERQLGGALPLVVYWVKVEVERALPDRGAAFERGRKILAGFADSPERQDAAGYLADKLGLSHELQAGLAPRRRAATGTLSPRVLGAGDRKERDALAACVAHPELIEVLAELGPEHFDDELHRRLQAHLIEPGGAVEPELLRLLAELDARAEAEGIDAETGKQLLLRLRERALERELAEASFERTNELQAALAKVREAVREFA
jgi:DNA primase